MDESALQFITDNNLTATYRACVWTVEDGVRQGAGSTLAEALSAYMGAVSDERLIGSSFARLDAYVADPAADPIVVRAVKDKVRCEDARVTIEAEAIEATPVEKVL